MSCAPLIFMRHVIMSNSTNDQTTPATVVATSVSLDALFAYPSATNVGEAPLAVAEPADAAAEIGVQATEEAATVVPAADAVPDRGPHPTIAKRIVFDGNAFDIPRGTPEVILNDNNALRRAYATAMARPELTQAHMEEGTAVIAGHTVPILTLRVRPQVKGASTPDAPSITELLQRVPGMPRTGHIDDSLVRYIVRGGRMTIGQAVRHKLGDLFDAVGNPRTTTNYGGSSICLLLDTVPSDAGAVSADVA